MADPKQEELMELARTGYFATAAWLTAGKYPEDAGLQRIAGQAMAKLVAECDRILREGGSPPSDTPLS